MENSYFASTDFSMLGYGCSLSQYPQIYSKYLDMYQMLPHPYKGYFDGFPTHKLIKQNWVLDLASQAETFI